MYYVASADLVFEYLKSKKVAYTIYLCYVSSTDHVLEYAKKLTVYELVISGCDNSSIQSINELPNPFTHRSNRSTPQPI